jgi:hypothetical protein
MSSTTAMQRSRFLLCLFSVMTFLWSPNHAVAQARSRAEEIEASRERKSHSLQADYPGAVERGLRYIKDQKVLERFTAGVAGFRIKLGGLVNGSGFALGPEYLRRDFARGRLIFRGAAQSSFKAYQKYDLQLSVPPTRTNSVFLDLYSA